MKPYWKYIIAGIRNEESTKEQRYEAFEAFVELYDDMQCYERYEKLELDETFYKEVMMTCIDYISSRVDTKDMSCAESTKLCDVMKDCFEHMDRLDAFNILLSHEMVFPWLFERILSVDDTEHEAYSLFLSMLLNWTEPSERVTIFIRYGGRLRNAICDMLSREEEYDIDIFDFCYSPEMMGFLASMAYTVYEWVQRWMPKDLNRNTKRFKEHWNECFVVVKVLKSALKSTKLLEKLLGYDLLRVARLLAFIPDTSNDQAYVFRKILNRYPEFQKSFRERTERGLNGNPVANLGRSIPPKAPTEGKWYILKDEDEE